MFTMYDWSRPLSYLCGLAGQPFSYPAVLRGRYLRCCGSGHYSSAREPKEESKGPGMVERAERVPAMYLSCIEGTLNVKVMSILAVESPKFGRSLGPRCDP